MASDTFKFRHPLRVRWAEVDPQGIVFNPNYLMYCDVAITEYWRAIGLAYPEGFLATGADTVVAKATLQYRAAARFDDELSIGVRCARLGTKSLSIEMDVARAGDTLVEAEIIYVTVTPDEHQSIPIPEALAARIRAFEAWE